MKKKNKTIKRLCIVVLCILIGSLPWIWVLYVSKILPYTQRWFVSYDSFHKKTGRIVGSYPKELPSSAEDIRYFYYTGWLDTKTGISFTVSDGDYQEMKEKNLSFFTAEEEDYQKTHQDYKEEERSKWYVFNEKVASDFLEEEKLEYLEEILQDKAEEYTMLAYEKRIGEDREIYVLSGIFCNDETNEIVMFAFKDTFRKEK